MSSSYPHAPAAAFANEHGAPSAALAAASVDAPPIVARLHALARRVLPRMYRPEQRLFAFTEREVAGRLVAEGVSVRYSAIALLGLDTLAEEVPSLDAAERDAISGELVAQAAGAGLGDSALIAWAAAGRGGAETAWRRLASLKPLSEGHETIEVAWALAALARCRPAGYETLAEEIAGALIALCDRRSGLFPQLVGGSGPRAHVTCFAAQVYPIHALSLYAHARGDGRALAVAARAANVICDRQGADGQWWWHYDVRTGGVIEGYPVYAIHQDAMAPLALRALAAAGGPRLHAHVNRGLAWLTSSPELQGKSLIDHETGVVWRKVYRHEPGKASRYIQAAAARLTGGRVPLVHSLFPPGAIDYEDRPYHWGWLLQAWTDRRPDGSTPAGRA